MHSDVPFDIYIECNEGIVDAGIIKKEISGRILHPTRKVDVWECGHSSLMVDTDS